MNFLLGLLALVLRGIAIINMVFAYVLVNIGMWIEAATEWADRKRGLQIVQVEGDEPPAVPAPENTDFHNSHCICWRCRHDRGED